MLGPALFVGSFASLLVFAALQRRCVPIVTVCEFQADPNGERMLTFGDARSATQFVMRGRFVELRQERQW